MSAAFDAYKFSKYLKEHGVDDKTAELYTEAFNEALFTTVATHDQLENMKTVLSGDIKNLKTAVSGDMKALEMKLSKDIEAVAKEIKLLAWTFGVLYPSGLVLLGLFLKYF